MALEGHPVRESNDSRDSCSSCDKRMTNRQGRGVLDKTEKAGAQNIHSRVEVEGVPSPSFSSPTAWHKRILMGVTYLSISLTNNLNSRSNVCCIDYYLKYRQDK